MAKSQVGFALSVVSLALCAATADAGFPFFGRGNHCAPLRQPVTSDCDDIPTQPAGAPPIEEEPDEETPPVGAAPAPAPVLFSAPAPTGEIQGARSSFELPSFRMTLPKIALETPSVRFNGGTRVRRAPQMEIDGATAGAATGPPILHGPLLGTSLQQQATQPQAGAAPAPPVKPSKDAGAAPSEPIHCTPGCAQQQSQEIQQLSQQVQQLQAILLQLTEQQVSEQDGDTLDSVEPASAVSVAPKRLRTASHQVSKSSTPNRYGRNRASQRQLEEELEELAAEEAARKQELEEEFAEKQAELEEMQSRIDQLELEQKRVLEAKLTKIDSDRERRLRSRLFKPTSQARPISQSSHEVTVDSNDDPESISQRKVSSSPAPTKRAQASRAISRPVALEVEDAE